jgi:FkbM family methyltransferase
VAEKIIVVRLMEKDFRVSIPRDHDYFDDYWNGYAQGTEEASMFRFLEELNPAGCVFLDVGAWIGSVSLAASTRFANVYAFEADPISAKDLARNLELNDLTSVRIVPKLVSTRSGAAKLYSMYSGNNSGSSVFHKDGKTAFDVKSISMQDFVEKEVGNDKHLAIKMDIEGSEYSVIPSMKRLLKSGRVIGLCLSLHPTLLSKKFPGNSVPAKIVRRLALTFHTLRVIRCLGELKPLYNAKGVPITFSKILSDIILHGRQSEDNRELYLIAAR